MVEQVRGDDKIQRVKTMTTREAYFKFYYNANDMPTICLHYATKDSGKINIHDIPIRFSSGHDDNIATMRKVEEKDNFFYWFCDPAFVELWQTITWTYPEEVEEF